MATELLNGVVLVAVVEDRPVVAAEDHERFLRDPQSLEGRRDLADAPVELHDAVAPRPEATGAGEPLVRHAGHVDVV